MCGWPAGLGYPPADGEQAAQQVAAQQDAEPEPDLEAEHSAAQLDALAGLAQRRSEPVEVTAGDEPAPEATVEETPETPETPEAEAPDAAASDEPAASEGDVSQGDASEGDVSQGDASEADDSVVADPLTAPLDAPAGGVDLDEATPIAEVAAAAAFETSQSHPATDRTSDPHPAVAAVGRASSLARPVQLLVVGAAVLNAILGALYLAFGKPIDDSMETLALGLSMFTLGVTAGATITFLYWVSRAYVHVVTSSAHEPRHGPTLSLAGWLIPVVGLFIGYRVLQDLWVGSDPDTRRDPDATAGNARMIDLWLLGIVTGLIFALVLPLALGDSAIWSGLAALGVLVAGLSLASVVGKVSEWQDQPDAVSDP